METPPAADAFIIRTVMLIRTDADKTHLLSCIMYIWSCVCVSSSSASTHTRPPCACTPQTHKPTSECERELDVCQGHERITTRDSCMNKGGFRFGSSAGSGSGSDPSGFCGIRARFGSYDPFLSSVDLNGLVNPVRVWCLWTRHWDQIDERWMR